MYVILGFFIIVLASVLEAYCSFQRQARPDIKHKIFSTWYRYIIEAGWIILLLGGGCVVLFFGGLGSVAIILLVIGMLGFWIFFPLFLNPIMRNRLLPSWEEVKTELEPKGYNEKNYWRGDWWMMDAKQKRRRR